MCIYLCFYFIVDLLCANCKSLQLWFGLDVDWHIYKNK